MSNYGYPKNVLNWEPQDYLGEVRPGKSRVLYFTVSADPTTTQTNTGILLVFSWLFGVYFDKLSILFYLVKVQLKSSRIRSLKTILVFV